MMKLVPSNPIVFVLVLAVIFAVGMMVGKMFKPKTEKFSDAYYGIPSTVQEFAKSPKVLPPVPENRGVLTHDDFCAKFDC